MNQSTDTQVDDYLLAYIDLPRLLIRHNPSTWYTSAMQRFYP